MIRTIIWLAAFAVIMLLTLILLFCYYLVRLILGSSKADVFAYHVTHTWGRMVVLSTGSRVKVEGRENQVISGNICIISNHQSLFDIPILLGWMNQPVGFIAKQELKKVPIINGWILAIHSAYIDRSNPRKAIESINKGIDSIRQGHPIALFPEGTRSKDGRMGEFKTGSLKLATQAGAIIQPVTITGSRRLYEASGKIKKSRLTLIIHPPIHPGDPVYKDKNLLQVTLQQIISQGKQ